MKLLEKENWWIWLVLAFLSGGSSMLVLGALLDVYDKEAWYYRWTKKLPKGIFIFVLILIGLISLFTTFAFSAFAVIEIPELTGILGIILSLVSVAFAAFMFALTVFQLQILVEVNAKLETPGREIYFSPYIWILGLIIPIIGWIMLVVMFMYLQIWYLVMLYRGKGTEI